MKEQIVLTAPAGGAPEKDRAFLRKQRAKRIVPKVVLYLILSLLALAWLIPFLFALSTSFAYQYNRVDGENVIGIYHKDYNWLWHQSTFDNYIDLFSKYNVIGGFVNSILYIVAPLFVGVFTSAMAAFGFARLRFPGKTAMFFTLLSTVLLPGVITMIPSYILYATVYNWTNTPLPLIIPGMFGAAMTMFLIRQYFLTLPKELEEAAQLDGMGWWGIFLKIALPLAMPVHITQIILSFNGMYNDYLGPLLYVGTVPNLRTLQLILTSIPTQGYTPYPLMMAGAIVALIPTFVLFAAAQKFFTEGIVLTGIKG